MAERKKLTMYYPPDFDPRLVPRIKRDPNFTCEIRMMLPFSVQCNTCGEFMYMGKKFNSRKENAQGEKYKGIQILRFYIKCSTCGAEMSFKTDPENGDYVMESGGSRTFEMWKEKNVIEEANLKERLEEDKQDSMRALENRTLDSKMEMDILDALDELKAINQRHQRVDTGSLLTSMEERRKLEATGGDLDEEDEALVRSIKFRTNADTNPLTSTADGGPVGEEDVDLVSAIIGPAHGEGGKPKHGKRKGAKKRKRGEAGEAQEGGGGFRGSGGGSRQPDGGDATALPLEDAAQELAAGAAAPVKDATALLLESMAKSSTAAGGGEEGAGDGGAGLKVKIKRKPAKKAKATKAQPTATEDRGGKAAKASSGVAKATELEDAENPATASSAPAPPTSSSVLGLLAGAYESDDSV